MKKTFNLAKNMPNHGTILKGNVVSGDYSLTGVLNKLLLNKEIDIRVCVNMGVFTQEGKAFYGIADEDVEYEIEIPEIEGWIPWKNRDREYLKFLTKIKAKFNEIEGWVYKTERGISYDYKISKAIEDFHGKMRIGDKMNLDLLYIRYTE